MKIELRYAEFHSPVFSSGKNFGMKLDCKKAGVRLWLDTETRMVSMLYNNNLDWFETWHSAQPLDQSKYISELIGQPETQAPTEPRKPGRPRVRDIQGE